MSHRVTLNQEIKKEGIEDSSLDTSILQDLVVDGLPMEKETVSQITFSKAQQQVIHSRGKNLLVSASAGAGKTAVLVERLCELVIKDRIPLSSILAMTFTEDAAREMKSRLKLRLMEQAGDPWIDLQLGQLETASISTIHSFCLDIVQRYYYLAHLSYSVVSHVDTGLADEQALAQAHQNALVAMDPQKRATLSLYLAAYGQGDKELQATILKFLELARSKPDWKAWIQSCHKPSEQVADDFYGWFALRIQALIDIFETMEETVLELSFTRADKQQEYLNLFQGKQQKLKACLVALEEKNYMAFGHRFVEYIETSGKFTPTINKTSFKEIQQDSRRYEKAIADALFTPEAFFQTAKETSLVQEAFVELAIAVQEEFLRLKKEAGFIDFSDMEQYAWQILQHDQASETLRNQYEVILIDEYQDTNDLQESIIQAIARKNNVFRVGDIKQSIYRFRQARPQLMKSHLEQMDDLNEVIAMQENYRSTKRLIDFNNTFFSQLMNVEGMEGQFSAMDYAKVGSPKQMEEPQKPIRFLFTEYQNTLDPKTGERMKENKAHSLHRKHRFDLIAHDISQKLEAKEIQMRDVAILTRTSTPHDELKQALESWGIRSIHHLRKGFYTNKAIQIVLSALRVIQDNRNDIALMAALCSPLTGLSQEDILPLLTKREDEQTLYQALHSSPEGYKVLALERKLRALKNKSLPEMVLAIYALNDFYDKKTTAQDKTNLDLLLQKAVEANGLLDLDGFLDSAGLEENLDKTSEAIPFGKEEDAVKISTIHASKGLQYKLVYILCEQTQRDMDAGTPIQFDADLGLSFDGLDVSNRLKRQSASHLALAHKRYLEDLEEKMRLLYVACTRAEQELVFVDALKHEDLYNGPLNTYALLNNKGFTSWFFHLFHMGSDPDVIFDKVETLYERPDLSVLTQNKSVPLRFYSLPTQILTSQTASETKQKTSWKQIQNQAERSSVQARVRGTLVHDIVSSIPYPYQAQDIEAFVQKVGMPLDAKGIEQILALNQNDLYQQFMDLPHEFECSYCTKTDNSYVHGFMDLVVELSNQETAVIDFKTDIAFDSFSLLKKYRNQLETYKEALQKIHPHKTIRAWIYSFSLKEMIEVR